MSAKRKPRGRAAAERRVPSRPVATRSSDRRLAGQRIALGVSGSIAAYKAAVLARLLLREGAEVQAVLTASAERFIGGATFAGLTGMAPLTDMFDPSTGGELHVDLATSSDLILLVPTTADLLARLASGRSDDLLTALVLCAACPVMAAPAMHPAMWSHPATQRNVATVEADGRLELIGPVTGEVASGETGLGRMAEPEDILAAVVARTAPHDLQGRRVVVTAGPTVEDIDPVRFLSNRSSGKMGFAIAERAAARGARVTLITGPVTEPTPYGVQRVDVRSAVAMRGAVWQALGPDLSHADVLVMAAAVGDFRPVETHSTKVKKGEAGLSLDLTQNPDILAEIGHARTGPLPVLIGFAVETGPDEKLVEYARGKLGTKRVDIVVANHAAESMGRDDNRATLVLEDTVKAFNPLPKIELADRILNWVATRLGELR